MAQLYFRYGTMNSGKSVEILKVAHNYEEQGKKVLIFTSIVDNRYGTGYVASRIGIKREAITVAEATDIRRVVEQHPAGLPDCVLIDEGQFLKKQHVIQLTEIVDELGIPVIVYGLKNDFSNHLFEGSEALLLYADKLEEIKTICWFCTKKATMVLRVKDATPVYTGQQIQVGGNDSYIPVCRPHYNHPTLSKLPVKQEKE
ncbi:thymidine kinase [Aneurinibacillus sp. Ricciae_BoGa-3]|uniref:thymidine kinase n=1 Tax=Aneurinibacillus sp. Ricciae_BoGa-3 TaxID=3022697 RepID=UPI00233FC764|nr:thymidine kinase [Aneurinibacillus sp. Ricciae_BoGa-3]WCK54368.1 thymidine kinase [Aneurinibacillus sp. Ricciae_BoGa-3]